MRCRPASTLNIAWAFCTALGEPSSWTIQTVGLEFAKSRDNAKATKTVHKANASNTICLRRERRAGSFGEFSIATGNLGNSFITADGGSFQFSSPEKQMQFTRQSQL